MLKLIPERRPAKRESSPIIETMKGVELITNELGRTALWDSARCSWEVRGVARGRRISAPLGPTLYDGTAGVGLFLAEVAAATGDRRAARLASGALAQCVHDVRSIPTNRLSFYFGRVGVAHALTRAATAMGSDTSMTRARAVLAPIHRSGWRDTPNDDAARGLAGAISPLISLSTVLDARLTDLARDIGDHLLAKADRAGRGWSWLPSSTYPVALTGYGHGASGFAHGFLELFDVTGERRFLTAARQAMRFERDHYDPITGAWEDRRPPRTEEQRDPTGPRPTHWCHGAPGIGWVRAKAWSLLGDDIFRREARIAIDLTVDALEDCNSLCLCHGLFGNCAAVLSAERLLGDSSRSAVVRAVIEATVSAPGFGERLRTRRGFGRIDDPTLLLGIAGIGHLLLRLNADKVPSVLFPSPRDPSLVA